MNKRLPHLASVSTLPARFAYPKKYAALSVSWGTAYGEAEGERGRHQGASPRQRGRWRAASLVPSGGQAALQVVPAVNNDLVVCAAQECSSVWEYSTQSEGCCVCVARGWRVEGIRGDLIRQKKKKWPGQFVSGVKSGTNSLCHFFIKQFQGGNSCFAPKGDIYKEMWRRL